MLAFSGSGCPRKARCCQGCLPEGTRQAALAAACPEQAASSAHTHTQELAAANPPRPESSWMAAGLLQCSSSWLQVFGHAHFLGCACLVTLVFLSVLLPGRGMLLPRQSATRQREGCTCKGSWLQVLRHAHVSGHVCVRCVLKACRRFLVMLDFLAAGFGHACVLGFGLPALGMLLPRLPARRHLAGRLGSSMS